MGPNNFFNVKIRLWGPLRFGVQSITTLIFPLYVLILKAYKIYTFFQILSSSVQTKILILTKFIPNMYYELKYINEELFWKLWKSTAIFTKNPHIHF